MEESDVVEIENNRLKNIWKERQQDDTNGIKRTQWP